MAPARAEPREMPQVPEEAVMSAASPEHIAKPHEHLWVFSMGKRFRVLAIFSDVDAANTYCARHDEAAVIACYGPFIIVANKHEGLTGLTEGT